MSRLAQLSVQQIGAGGSIVAPEANRLAPLGKDFSAMGRRRFQNPKPNIRGDWWTIRIRRDDFVAGERKRVRTDVRIAPATMSEREAQKVAAEYMRPINQGLESLGSATNFNSYVTDTYIPVVMPLLAKSTRSRMRA